MKLTEQMQEKLLAREKKTREFVAKQKAIIRTESRKKHAEEVREFLPDNNLVDKINKIVGKKPKLVERNESSGEGLYSPNSDFNAEDDCNYGLETGLMFPAYGECESEEEFEILNRFQKGISYFNMLRKHRDAKPILSLDWLEFWASAKIKNVTGNYTIDEAEIVTIFQSKKYMIYMCNFIKAYRYYGTVADIYLVDIENDTHLKVANWAGNPRAVQNKDVEDAEYKIKIGTCNVTIANEILYSNEIQKYVDILSNIFVWNSLTRVDFAYDNTPGLLEVGKIIKNNRLPQDVKAAGRGVAKELVAKGQLQRLQLGNDNSEKKAVFYDKKHEIQTMQAKQGTDYKQYILKRWSDAGLDFESEKHVWRSELRFRGETLKKLKVADKESGELKDITVKDFIENLDNVLFLHDVARALNDNLLQLRLKVKGRDENGKSTTFCETLDLIQDLFVYERTVFKKKVKKSNHDFYKLKMTLHFLYKQVLCDAENENQYISQLAFLLQNNRDAEKYFYSKTEQWHKKYAKNATIDRNIWYINQNVFAKSQILA